MGSAGYPYPLFIPHTWCAGMAWCHRWYRLTNFTEKAVFTWPLYAWGIFVFCHKSVLSCEKNDVGGKPEIGSMEDLLGTYSVTVEDYVIWGMTALIIESFLNDINNK